MFSCRSLDAESNGDALLYDGASTQIAKERSAALPFAASYEIEVYQHRWTLRVTPMPSLAVDSKEPLAILVAGILISALLGLITWTITAGHARSVAANERLRFDIARRRQLEQELRAKEESFRFLFQKSPNAMWVVDRESLRFLQVNEQAVTTYGYSEQEFLRMRITDIKPPDDIPRVTSLYQEDEAGFRTTGPWRHVLKSGKVIDVEVSGTSISFAGRPSRLAIVRDISERVASDLALRQSEERFRNLVEGSIQGILVHDAAGKPLFINRAFTRIYGFETPEEVLQLDSLDHLIPPDELERILAYRRARLRGEPAPSRYECRRLRRDGTMMWLENRPRLIEWNGKPAIQAVIIDITERKRAEEELLQAQKLEAVGHLTGGVAHDFNNLLTVILGNAEILADQLRGDERLRKLAEMTRVAAENGAELTRQLLAFARAQSG